MINITSSRGQILYRLLACHAFSMARAPMENLFMRKNSDFQRVRPLDFPPRLWGQSSVKPDSLISEIHLGWGLKNKANVLRVSAIQEIQTHNDDKRVFIFGMGFVGQNLAEQLKNKGWSVSGTCTSEEKKKELEENGYEAFIFRIEDEMNGLTLTSFKALYNASHIISCIPPVVGLEGDPVLFQHGELLRDALSRGNICWIGYLSSTTLSSTLGCSFGLMVAIVFGAQHFPLTSAGVYGHWGGDWVDEDSPAKPDDKAASARLEAEKAWMALGHNVGIPVQIFRLGGIYGLGRSAIDTIIRQKQPTRSQKARESRRYTSRVHIADICQAILASIELPFSGKIYNVVDDDPAPRAEVFSFAKSLLTKKWPAEQWEAKETETLTGGMNATFNSCGDIAEKRVSNKRLKNELKVKLFYPSYRLGLESIVESMDKHLF